MKNFNKLAGILKNLEKAKSDLEDLLETNQEFESSKQDSFDDKSEKWQNSDKGNEAQELLYDLANEIQTIEDAILECSNAIESLQMIESPKK